MRGLRVSRRTQLEPFNPDGLCPKCGHDDIHARHEPGCGVESCDQHAEHIERYCRRCSFRWPEAVLA